MVSELTGTAHPNIFSLHAAAAGGGGSVQGEIGSLGAVLAD
ncbi:MAG: hypothetical protein RBS80_26630 [Thermoguttaceae bacterium]|nr:hypothetical protein [Thermoguttaceae bacterium]